MQKQEKLRLASWNINSVRLRIEQVLNFLASYDIDILALQETKCQDCDFPLQEFINFGYNHTYVRGQKSYNGVALISRVPLYNINRHNFCDLDDARHISAEFELGAQRVLIHNYYVPAGGEVPDIELNPKFAHKLKFLSQMHCYKSTYDGLPSILVGDLNIAPEQADVWNHKALLDVVSHTPIECELMRKLMQEGSWVDLVRNYFGENQKLYSWWSYRSPNWQVADKGRRLDHIWVAPTLVKKSQKVEVIKEMRGKLKPSDHVPIIAQFINCQ